MDTENKKKYVVRIGPLLKQVIEEQLQGIRDVTYGSVKSSFFEAGEIVARKFKGDI